MKNPKGPDSDGDQLIDNASASSLQEGRKISPLLTLGDSGLKRQGGYVLEEFLRDLQGKKATKIYNQMAMNDAICGSIVMAFTTMVRQVRWFVKPAGETAIAKAHAKFVEECLFVDMDNAWTDFMAEVATIFTFGYAPMEMVFKVRRGDGEKDPRFRSKFSDGKVGVRRLALRAQKSIERWDFTPGGDILGLWQNVNAEIGKVYIPRERLLLFRTEAISNNPEGRSLLRNAYRSYYFKERLEAIEAIGAERDLAGLPIMRIPSQYMSPDASDQEKAIFAKYTQVVQQIVRDENEGLVMPSDRDDNGNLRVELELLGTGGTRQFDTTAIINRYNLAMATSVLADFILLGQRTVGSFALSDNKTAMFQTSLGAYLDAIQEQLNRRLLSTLWELNGFPIKTMPTLEHEDVDSPTLEILGAYVKNLTDSGAMGNIDTELVNSLRQSANLPLHEGDISLPAVHPENAPKPEPGAAPAAKPKKPAGGAAK